MTLRADREVEVLASRDLEVERHRRRVEIEVGVDQRDPVAVRRERARLDRVALAEVPVVVDDAETDVAASAMQLLCRLVDRAVGDDDHLDVLAGQPVGERTADHVDVLDDLLSSVVDRQDRRQHRFDCNHRPRRAVRSLRDRASAMGPPPKPARPLRPAASRPTRRARLRARARGEIVVWSAKSRPLRTACRCRRPGCGRRSVRCTRTPASSCGAAGTTRS